VTSEVTPHHLLLADSEIRKLGWRGWMVPPLRSKAARNGLFRALLLGKVTMVATDHAPHAVREKKQSPDNSPPGVPGLETAMPLMLTMMNKGRVSLRRLVSLLSSNPARVFGLRRKGTLERGADGDLVLVDLKRKSVIDPEKFLSKAHYSPFEGWRTTGAIHTTVVNGRMVYSDGEIVGKLGVGRVLRAGRRA
jgi:dihydroorotase